MNSALDHPGRGWVNLGIAAAMYLIWYLTGQATRLVRSDSEGADLGFMEKIVPHVRLFNALNGAPEN